MDRSISEPSLISVVIPVYNAAHYLESCVSSLRALPLSLEVVLVDDGSTDGSGALCDRLGDRVLHQSNKGVSAARNAGMKLATGEWLWFVDADDYIEPLKEMLPAIPAADFVSLGFVWEENGKTASFGANTEEIPYNLWRCWFRREKVVECQIHFTQGRKYAEDQEFILRYLLLCKNLIKKAVPQIRYHYTVRPGSAMTRKGAKWIQVGNILGVLLSLWGCALRTCSVPVWIWFQTRRLLKTAIVTACKI